MKLILCALASACTFAACSDTEPQLPEAHEGKHPLYLAATRIWDDSATTSYLHVVDARTAASQSAAARS